MKHWKKTLVGVVSFAAAIFAVWPGDKPSVVTDIEPFLPVIEQVLSEPDILVPDSTIDRVATNGAVVVDRVLRVYDGDTFYCDVDCWPAVLGDNIGIRIRGIDTPEIRGSSDEVKEHAEYVRDYAKRIVDTSEVVELRNIGRGKYFRVLADVYCDGQNLAAVLISRGYAKFYDGGTKPTWDANDFENWEMVHWESSN